MLDVCCLGILRENLDSITRIIEVERVVPEGDEFVKDRFAVQEWKKMEGSYFMNLPEGSLVAIRGRLETHPEHGCVIIVEQLTPLTSFKVTY